MKKADAILAADLHLMERTPICRTDDFIQAMIDKLRFINDLVCKHECPLLIAGDIFDKSKVSPELTSLALEELTASYAIPGNHDLLEKTFKNIKKCSFNVLVKAHNVKMIKSSKNFIDFDNFELSGAPFGEEVYTAPLNDNKKSVLLLHEMIHKDKPIHKDMNSTKAISLLKRYNYDLIVTGDNHEPFTVEYEGRLLVNCGSMMRIRADQINYKPCVWLWYADTNTVEPVYLPIEEGVVIRTHIEKKEAKDERMNTFVERIDKSYEIGLSFKDNMEAHFSTNKIAKGVKSKLYEAMED